MAGYPYYLNGIGCDIIKNFGTEIKQLIASDPRPDKAIGDGQLMTLRWWAGLGKDFDYCLGFYTAMAYAIKIKKEAEEIKKEAEQRLIQQEISMREQQFKQMLRQQSPQPQQPPQPAIPASKMEKRYQQMRQGTVKPRFRSDVPTELLRKMRERGYSYERISRETGLSKSAVIYRLK